jgi:hypothetical protein
VTIEQLSAEETRTPTPENQGWIVGARIAMALDDRLTMGS